MNPWELTLETFYFILSLNNVDLYSIRQQALEVWEQQNDKSREEIGIFQAFDFSLASIFFPFTDFARENFESLINASLENEPIKIELTQQKIGGVSTATFEIRVLAKTTNSENWQELN